MIYGNTGVGIRLLHGANDNQAAPVLTSAVSLPGGVRVTGPLTGTANTRFTIELYADGGQAFLGGLTAKTDKHGIASFTFNRLPAGDTDFVATATSPDGNTSEFSAPLSLGS